MQYIEPPNNCKTDTAHRICAKEVGSWDNTLRKQIYVIAVRTRGITNSPCVYTVHDPAMA